MARGRNPKEAKEETKGKHPGGRPSKYKPEYNLAAEYMARNGLTDAEIAEKLGISEATITNWKNDYPEFLASLKRGKAEPDENVEKSLYQRAIGYDHKAVKIFMPANAEAPVYADYTEHWPPDVTAQIFWLKNRRPERWREKQDVELSGSVQIIDDIPKKRGEQ